MARYALVSESGDVMNVIVLIDTADYQCPAGCSAVEDVNSEAAIGGTWTAEGGFIAPTEPEEPEALP